VLVFAVLHTGEIGLLLALGTVLTALLESLFPRLRAPETPQGIVTLQLAWTPERARRILGAWAARGWLGRARKSVYVDFPFIAAYSGTLACLGLCAGRVAGWGGIMDDADAHDFGASVAVAMIAAGACDVAENLALLGVLSGRYAPWTAVMSSFASTKLMLLIVGAPLAVIVVVAGVLDRVF
jgi:hypothetical protein